MVTKPLFVACLLLAYILALCPALPAAAQASTPTPTMTPLAPYYTTEQLSTGSTLLIERRVTFGDLFVGFAALIAAVVIAATSLPDLAARIFKR